MVAFTATLGSGETAGLRARSRLGHSRAKGPVCPQLAYAQQQVLQPQQAQVHCWAHEEVTTPLAEAPSC